MSLRKKLTLRNLFCPKFIASRKRNLINWTNFIVNLQTQVLWKVIQTITPIDPVSCMNLLEMSIRGRKTLLQILKNLSMIGLFLHNNILPNNLRKIFFMVHRIKINSRITTLNHVYLNPFKVKLQELILANMRNHHSLKIKKNIRETVKLINLHKIWV